ncbi:hypothetical protein LguiB_033178 [Lonicera macranthoides]
MPFRLAAGGGRRVVLPSLVVVLIISILQIWLCSNTNVGAIRLLAENKWSIDKDKNTTILYKNMKMTMMRESFLNRFFNGSGRNFEEIKRRVPTCPDPLHNK